MPESIFLTDSEKIKKEIQSNPELLEKIKQCFARDTGPFAKGTENELYRIGQTNEGKHLLLRKKPFTVNIKNDKERFEAYCQYAETLANSRAEGKYQRGSFGPRKNSPNFCIGVIFNTKEVGIITEDMSEGGKYEMSNSMVDYYSTRSENGNKVDEVLVDLDSCRADGYFDDEEVISSHPYFSPENVLEIT